MKRILIWLVLLGPAVGLYAQQSTAPAPSPAGPKETEWHLLLEPYIMFGNLNGNVAMGTQPVSHVDEDPSTLFKNLNFGSMLYAEAYSDRWVLSSDFIYMKLGSDLPPSDEIESGHVTLKQLSWELAVMKRVKPWLALGIAGQLNSMKTDLSVVSGGTPQSGSETKAWVDPSVVAAMKMPLSKKWTLRVRGNIGGFGLSSKIYWQTQAYMDWRLTRLFQLSAGYRAIKIDHEKGTGNDYFLYNLITFGPMLRFGFNF